MPLSSQPFVFPHRAVTYRTLNRSLQGRHGHGFHCCPSSARSPFSHSQFVYHPGTPLKDHTHTHSYGLMTSRPASPDATLVSAPRHDERRSLRLKIRGGKSNILNSVVVDAAGQPLYTITTNSKRTTFVGCNDNVEIVTVQWDRSSPRMVFRGKKMKCREWLPPAGPETESVHAVQAPLLLAFAVAC
jgi:hypothetical protein